MRSFRPELVRLIMLVGLFHFVFPRTAHAYLDPGSTSYALQMVIAALVAAGFAIKTYWGKLKSFFSGSNLSSERRGEDTGDSPTEKASRP